jgi:hypothetical protein
VSYHLCQVQQVLSSRAVGVAFYGTCVARGFQVANRATLERLLKIAVLAARPRRRPEGLASVLVPVPVRKNASVPRAGGLPLVASNMTDNNRNRGCRCLRSTRLRDIYPKLMGKAFPIFG